MAAGDKIAPCKGGGFAWCGRFVVEPELARALPATAIVATLGFVVCWLIGKRSRAMAPVLSAFFLHLGVSMAIYARAGVSLDAAAYHTQALSFVSWLHGEAPMQTFHGKESWVWMLGGLYWLFGPLPPVGLAVNATLMGISSGLIASAARLSGWARDSSLAAWLALLSPAALFWPSLLGREALLFFLMSVFALSIALFLSRRTVVAASLLWLAAVLGMFSRPEATIAAVGAITVSVVMLAVARRSSWGSAVGLLAPLLIVLPLAVSRGLAAYVQKFLTGLGDHREVLANDANSKTGVSTFGFDTPLGAIVGTFRDLPRGLLGPLPWEWTAAYWQLVGDAIFWAVVVSGCIAAFVVSRDRVRLMAFALPGLALIFIATAIMGNWGILVRMRTQAVPFLVIVASVGVGEVYRRIKQQQTSPTTLDATSAGLSDHETGVR